MKQERTIPISPSVNQLLELGHVQLKQKLLFSPVVQLTEWSAKVPEQA